MQSVAVVDEPTEEPRGEFAAPALRDDNGDRSRRADRRWLAALLVAFAVSALWWDLQYRHGKPYDIDEAGYLVISLNDLRALYADGVIGWIRQVETPTGQAPLMTASTTILYLVFGPRALAGLLAPLLFCLVTVAATFALARRITSRRAAWAAAVLTATAPVLLNYSRSYHFAAPAMATTAGALYCLARSRGLASWRWTVGFGVCVALMPLARTMAIVFVPGVLAGAACIALAQPRPLARLGRLLCGIAVAVGVASLWFGVNGNGRLVWEYLTGFGYGSAARAYGEPEPLYSLQAWLSTLQALTQCLYLTHLLAVGAALLAGVWIAARTVIRARRPGTTSTPWSWRGLLGSPLVPLATTVAFGALALSSSSNKGSVFAAPLVPPLCILTAIALDAVVGRWVLPAAGAVAVTSLPLILGLPWASGSVTLPAVGAVTVTTGLGTLHPYEQAVGVPWALSMADARFPEEQWVRANDEVAGALHARYGGTGALTAFGYRHRMLNSNSVNLATVLAGHPMMPITMVAAERVDDTVVAYRHWLTAGEATSACVLFTASGLSGEMTPLVTTSVMEAAAAESGFTRAAASTLPDGRAVTEWRRASTCPS